MNNVDISTQSMENVQKRQQKQHKHDIPEILNLNPRFQAFLNSCFCPPENRPTADQICQHIENGELCLADCDRNKLNEYIHKPKQWCIKVNKKEFCYRV